MPIIKDKYGAKGAQTRSKFLTRKINRAIIEPVATQTPITATGSTTQQTQEAVTKNYRSKEISKDTSSKRSTIGHYNFISADTAVEILKLNKGQSLLDLVIHNYNSISSRGFISIYWSPTPPDPNNTFTFLLEGFASIIASTSELELVRLIAIDFPYLGTTSIKDIVSTNFNNVSKDIYFYAVSQNIGPSITYTIGKN